MLAVNDLVGGHVDMFVGSLPQMIELVRAGTATGIGVTGTERSSTLPDLPTLAESGVPGYELEQWWGIVVPAGTPAPSSQKLNAELNAVSGHSRHRSFHDARGRPRRHPRRPKTSTSISSASFSAGVDIVLKTIGLRKRVDSRQRAFTANSPAPRPAIRPNTAPAISPALPG